MNNINVSRFRTTGVMRIAYFVPRRCVLGTTKAKFIMLVGLPAMLRIALQAGHALGVASLFWFGALTLLADTHYVSLAGTSESPYTNGWASAATNIQWAVDQAAAPDTVLVSNGTYNLTNTISFSKSITVRSLYGTNSISTWSIINGNYPDYTNKCVYMGGSAAIHPVMNGFIITNGYYVVNGSTDPRRGGGGVEIYNGGELFNCFVGWNTVSVTNGSNNGGGGIYLNPSTANSYTTVSNCTVVSNTVLDTGSGDRNGGGILSVYALATVTVCRVTGNYAINGGGMYMSSSGLVVSNCTVYGNTALSSGGGILASYGVVTDCVISNNNVATGTGGGGVSYTYNGKFMNSIIIGNRSKGVGGVDLTHGSSMSNCQVIANISTNSGAGGVNASGTPLSGVGSVISDCVIAYNLGKAGAGLSSTGSATVSNLVRNCLIYGNTNEGGAGGVSISLMGQYPYGLINCTIANNEAGTKGGGLYTDNINNYIGNCIIYGNVTTNDDNDEVYVNTTGGTNNFWYNCTPNMLTNLPPNQGNTTNNPLFINAGNRNYRLGSGSPCINTGTNMLDWMTGAVDLDRRIRIRYGRVDMGAYEAIYSGTIYGFW